MKGWKSFLAGMVTMLLIVSLMGTVFAATGKVQKELEYRDIKVSLNGEILDLKDAAGNHVEPFMFDGTNYLPVRALAEALGLSVSWDGQTNTVKLTNATESESNKTPVVTPQAPTAPAVPATPPAVTQTTPIVENTNDSNTAKTVYVTKTGKRYHYDPSCNGGTYIPSTLSSALSRGLTPCNKCVK